MSATSPIRIGGAGLALCRVLVPFTSFSEPDRLEDGTSEPVWFTLGEDTPLAFVGGIWTSWTSTRKLTEGEVICDPFAFVRTDALAEVGDVHPKVMPVILTESSELETWLSVS